MVKNSLFSTNANSRQKAIDEAVLNLCRRGVLILGYKDGDPTYQVTKEFEQRLNNSRDALLQIGGDGGVSIGDVAWLALLSLYGDFEEDVARDLWETLVGVLILLDLRASLEACT